MKLATWNVNSIRARRDRVVAWLERHQPDVLCMQETKVEDDGFPTDAFAALGYEVAITGQKAYNGVAIASRLPMTDVRRGLDDADPDDQARLIAATIAGTRVACAYFPNGEAVDSPKYAYKLRWIERLRGWLDRHGDPRLILCGDFNVMPEDRDCWNPELWTGKVLFSEREKQALRDVAAWGLHDAFRKHHDEGGVFSYFDYQGVSLFKNQGLRIDHVYVTPALLAACTSCEIDREARKGQGASDHAPVIAMFEGGP